MSHEKNWIAAFMVKVIAKVQNVNECLSGWYLLNCRTFCYQTWYGDASSWAGVSYKKIGLLSLRSRSQGGFIWSKYDSFYYILWTADPFAAKLRFIVHFHKQECFMTKLDCYVQGPDHSKIWKCHWMFVQIIFSESLNLLLPNLVLWCIIMQELIRAKYDNVYCIFWTADSVATKLGLIVHYHKAECFMEKLDCCVQDQGHSKISKCQWMFVQMISSEMLNLLLVMHHYEPDWLWERLVCCLQGQGHS